MNKKPPLNCYLNQDEGIKGQMNYIDQHHETLIAILFN